MADTPYPGVIFAGQNGEVMQRVARIVDEEMTPEGASAFAEMMVRGSRTMQDRWNTELTGKLFGEVMLRANEKGLWRPE